MTENAAPRQPLSWFMPMLVSMVIATLTSPPVRAGEQVSGLWQLLRRGAGLAALPGLIRLVSHHAQRCERRVTGPAGTASATATEGASQATAAEQATEQTTQAAEATRSSRATRSGLTAAAQQSTK